MLDVLTFIFASALWGHPHLFILQYGKQTLITSFAALLYTQLTIKYHGPLVSSLVVLLLNLIYMYNAIFNRTSVKHVFQSLGNLVRIGPQNSPLLVIQT